MSLFSIAPKRGRALFLTLAEVQLASGRPDQAITTLRRKVLPLLEHLPTDELAAVAWTELGRAQAARGDLQAALENLRERALPIYNQLRDREGRAFVQSLIAATLRDRLAREVVVAGSSGTRRS